MTSGVEVPSALEKLAVLRMQERELLASTCARCGHRLGHHSIASNLCSGELGGKQCKCAGWCDPGEKLAL